MPEILEVKLLGNPILSKKALNITKITPYIKELIENMIFTMYETNGVGLAAPQVGESIKLFVCDAFYSDQHDKNPLVIINPEFIEYDGEDIREEGCLSLPNVYEKVKRFAWVKMKYYDISLKENIIEADELFAVVLQHEYDHLNGITLFDKMNPVRKMSNAFKLKAIKEKGSQMSENVTKYRK